MAAVLIGVGSLLYTSRLVRDIEATERQKMELWAEAIRIIDGADFETDMALPFLLRAWFIYFPRVLN